MFLGLFPLSLLVPCNVLFEQGPVVFAQVGSADFTLYELLVAVLGVAFIALGTRLQSAAVTLSGIAGTAVFIVRATELHFEDSLTWPLVLAASGAVAMVVGVVVAFARARRQA